MLYHYNITHLIHRDIFVGMSLQQPNTPQSPPPSRLSPLSPIYFSANPGQSAYNLGRGNSVLGQGEVIQ